MNLEKLKELLENGEITQEEFDQRKKELEDENSDDEKEKEEDKKEGFDIKELLDSDEFQKFIQSREDKLRTEYSKKLKDRDETIDKLKKEKMTDEERFEHEKREHEEEKRLFEKQKLDYETLKLINKKKLDEDVLDFISGSDLETREKQLELFEQKVKDVANRMYQEELDKQERDVNTGGKDAESITEAEFFALNIGEQEALIQKHPSLEKKFLD